MAVIASDCCRNVAMQVCLANFTTEMGLNRVILGIFSNFGLLCGKDGPPPRPTASTGRACRPPVSCPIENTDQRERAAVE